VPARSSTWIAASGGLARLVVILGLLVGLTALQGTHCREDFQLAHVAMCPTIVFVPVDIDIADGPTISDHGAVLYQASATDPHFPVGVAGMCVALLVAVLLLMIGTVRPGFLGIAPLRTGFQRAVKRRNHRALRLAMICVLRT
jgi:hypothetical protein